MGFQLVRASDTDIAVWQTEHGHIYVFAIAPGADSLTPLFARGAPEAAEPVEAFAEDALRFATEEARKRNLFAAGPAKSKRARGRSVMA